MYLKLVDRFVLLSFFLLAIVLSVLRFTDSDYPCWYLQTQKETKLCENFNTEYIHLYEHWPLADFETYGCEWAAYESYDNDCWQ